MGSDVESAVNPAARMEFLRKRRRSIEDLLRSVTRLT
jgi:hypothetical protein